MKIPVNKNIEEYKDDFFKGLTLRQTVTAAAAVVSGIAVFILCYAGKAPQTISVYLTMPVVFLIGGSGFLKLEGMSPVTYIRRWLRGIRSPLYVSVPDAIWYMEKGKPKQKAQKTGRQETKKQEAFLESEEELEARGLFYESLWKEKEEGI